MTYPDYPSQPQQGVAPSNLPGAPAPADSGQVPGSPMAGAPHPQNPAGPGAPGAPGYPAVPGTLGAAGYPGAPGYSGTAGYSGTSGYQGALGYQGSPYPASFPGVQLPAAQDPATVNCVVPWFLGLLLLVPIPVVGWLSGGLGPVIAGLSWKVEGAITGRAQARQAASWGLTYLLCSLVLFVAYVWMLLALTKDGPVKEFFPLGIPLAALGLLTLFHLVLCVVGGVWASQGKTMPFYGIPFFR